MDPIGGKAGAHFPDFVMRSAVLLIALATFGLVQSANAASGDWRQWGYTARGLRQNTHESQLTRKTVPHLVLKWSQPVEISYSSPAVANGMLYIGCLDGSLRAFDAISGTPAWSAKVGSHLDSSPAVADGTVYVGSDDGSLYAVNAESGALRWSVIVGAPVVSSPTIAHGKVFVGNTQGTVFALDAKTGMIKWQQSRVTNGAISTPAVAHELVYAADAGGLIYAYDEDSGQVAWMNGFLGHQFAGAPAVDADNVYILGDSGLKALDAATGSEVWEVGAGQIQSSIAVAHGQVYSGSLDHLLFDFATMNGTLLYDATVQNTTRSTPALANGVLYIGSDAGTVEAYDAKTGMSLWSAQIGGSVVSSPTVSNGMLYAGAATLNAYGLP